MWNYMYTLSCIGKKDEASQFYVYVNVELYVHIKVDLFLHVFSYGYIVGFATKRAK